MTAASTPGPVTFVLSGGASLGAIQVGMLRALVDRGIVPDTIVATSVGAINGAFIASHGPTSASGAEGVPPPCPLDVQPIDFGHAEALMSRAEAAAGAFRDGRTRTVVPLPPRRRRRREAPDAALADPPPAS
jgi:hypothetical protein